MHDVILSHGTQESGYLQTMISSSAAYAIAQACDVGKNSENCNLENSIPFCDSQTKQGHGGMGEYQIAEHINFGQRKSCQFYQLPIEKEPSAHSRTALHNFQLGLEIMDSKRKKEKCQCHGLSGSCAVKTCWKTLPQFKQIAKEIKKKYDKVYRLDRKPLRVKNENDNDEAQLLGIIPQRYKSDIVFYEKQDHCKRNKELGSAGTKGRECDPSKDKKNGGDGGFGSCDHLCCNRGIVRKTREFKVQQNCKFEWCCQIRCENRIEKRTVHYCK